MANVGGQAVLEGVMMRGPGNWAVAVRKPSGEIAQVSRPIDSAMARHRVFRLPVIRGVMALGESLAIGFRALAISANYASQQEGEDGEVETELSRGALVFAFLIAIGFAVAVFKVGPALITDQLPIRTGEYFVVVEGLIRVAMFVGYLALISLLPDLKRVFQYHAAEHKAINAYEAGEPLEPEIAQRYSLIHPRCGTAFLLWVMVLAVFVFAFFGRPTSAKTKTPMTITQSRNAVPHRGWIRLCRCTVSGVSSSPASSALIALCSAAWYWKTRRRSGRNPINAM